MMGRSSREKDSEYAGSSYEQICEASSLRDAENSSRMGMMDRLPLYALILGILSLFCVFFSNGYLISMLGLLIDAHALNKGTRKQRTATAAAICCALSILIYIVFVAARPLLADMPWYMFVMEKAEAIFG